MPTFLAGIVEFLADSALDGFAPRWQRGAWWCLAKSIAPAICQSIYLHAQKIHLLFATLMLTFGQAVWAGDPEAKDAIAMVEKTAEMIKKTSFDAVKAKIAAKDPELNKGELYAYIRGLDGTTLVGTAEGSMDEASRQVTALGDVLSGISATVANIDQASQMNSAEVEKSAAASSRLLEHAEQLNASTAMFTLPRD